MADPQPTTLLRYAEIAERLLAHRLARPQPTRDDAAALHKTFRGFAGVFALDHAAQAGQPPRAMLSALVDGLVEATQAASARIILKTDDGALTVLGDAFTTAKSDAAGQEDSLTARAVADGGARSSDIGARTAAIDRPEGPSPASPAPASLAVATLTRRDGETIGAVQLFGSRPAAFAAADLALATEVGTYIAELAVTAGLLPWLADTVRLLAQPETARTGDDSPAGGSILSRLLTVAIEIVGADRGWILLYDPTEDELYTALSEGIGSRELRISARDGIAGAAFRTGELINVPLAYQDPRFNPAIDAMVGYRTRSILCAPILSADGQRLGVLQVLNKRRGAFDDADESHLRSLASQMGVTRDYTALFEQVRGMQSYNESMLRSLTNGVLTVDMRGEVTFVNQAALATLRRTEAEMLGMPLMTLFGEMNAWVMEALDDVSSSGAEKLLPNSEFYIESDGDWVLANLAILPLLDSSKKALGFMLVIENLERERELRRTMSRYVSNEVIDRLVEDEGAALGGTAQTATTLFADIRSFTSLSESLGAAGTVSMLNEYFSYMEDVLTNHAGIIDKYVGDAVMAVFGLPFPGEADAQNSVLAACDMQQALELLNVRRTAAGGDPLRIGIGIATGTVISGNIGSPKRMDFTVIGDPVNLASRIESMTKGYGAEILICEETMKRQTTAPKRRRIDVVRVRGQTRPTNLYEIFEHRAAHWTPALDEAITVYEAGLDAYIAGDWTAAQRHFEGALRLRADDKAAVLMIERCQRYRAAPPERWDGVSA